MTLYQCQNRHCHTYLNLVDFTPERDEIKCNMYDDWVGPYGKGSQRSVNLPTFAHEMCLLRLQLRLQVATG